MPAGEPRSQATELRSTASRRSGWWRLLCPRGSAGRRPEATAGGAVKWASILSGTFAQARRAAKARVGHMAARDCCTGVVPDRRERTGIRPLAGHRCALPAAQQFVNALFGGTAPGTTTERHHGELKSSSSGRARAVGLRNDRRSRMRAAACRTQQADKWWLIGGERTRSGTSVPARFPRRGRVVGAVEARTRELLCPRRAARLRGCRLKYRCVVTASHLPPGLESSAPRPRTDPATSLLAALLQGVRAP